MADALVEVRDGKATWHESVSEEILVGDPVDPSAATATNAGAVKAPAKGGGKSVNKSGGNKKAQSDKDRKRNEAEKRNNQHQNTKELRKRLRSVEKQWQKAEDKVADLQQRLADPEVYEDAEAVKTLTRDYDQAKDAAAKLAADWEQAATAVENAS